MILEVFKNLLTEGGAKGNATVKVINDTGDVIDDIINVTRDKDGIIYIHFTTA